MFIGFICKVMERTFEINEPVVEGINKTNTKYLLSLFAAIKNVSIGYIRYTNHNVNPNSSAATEELIKRSNAEISHVERVFAYELYRQWCEQDIVRNTPQLVINAEIPKQFIDGESVGKSMLYYPDMVLHFGQNDYRHNFIICEIKRKEYVDSYPEKMNDDINKLVIYVDEKTKTKYHDINWEPFAIGVFLMTVKELKITENEKYTLDLLLRHFNQDVLNLREKDVAKKIVCIIYNGQELRYDTLYNMLNK